MSTFNGDITFPAGGEAGFGRFRTERLASPPALLASEEGRVYYDTTEKKYFFNNGIEWLPFGSGNGGGATVFASSVESTDPDGNVFNVVTGGGDIVSSFSSSSLNLRINFIASSGSTYKPIITINGDVANDVDVVETSPGFWEGFVDTTIVGVNDGDTTQIEILNNDGFETFIDFTYVAAPTIQSALIGGYPGSQTEVKEDDTISLSITADKDFVKFTSEITDVTNVTKTSEVNFVAATSRQINVTVADRGNATQALSVKFRVEDANGSISELFVTGSQGSTDGIHTIRANNTHPVINPVIVYPASQEGFKITQSGTLTFTGQNYNTLSWTSPNGAFSIPSPSTLVSPVNITCASNVAYEDETDNLQVVANRAANDSTTTVTRQAIISNSLPTIDITHNVTRYRSSDAGETYVLTVNSDQHLISVDALVAPEGTLSGVWTEVDSKTWTTEFTVVTADVKGDHVLTGLQVTSSVNEQQTAINSGADYTLGGFLAREISVPPFTDEVAIGDTVLDTTKLVTLDFDEIEMNYVAALTDGRRNYTISDGAGNPVASGGTHFLWLDVTQVQQNSITKIITIEELE